jgi:hypothetical protein
MGELKRISSHGVNCVLYSFRGEVGGAWKGFTTEVSGGGGSGYVHKGTGHSTIREVTSKTTEHNQFFLRSPTGEEKSVRLADVAIAVRDGHDVTVIWGTAEGRGEGPYLAVINHTTGEQTRIDSGIQTLAQAMGCWTLCVGLVIVVGGAIYSVGSLIGNDGPFLARLLMAGAAGAAALFAARYLWKRARRTTDAIKEIQACLDGAVQARK